MSDTIECVICDCCNCTTCVSDTDHDVDIYVTPTDICKNGLCNLGAKQTVPLFTRDVNPCIDAFGSLPGSCAGTKQGGKITYWVHNQTDHCIAVFLSLDITNLSGVLCHVETKTPAELSWYSFPAGNRTEEAFGLMTVTSMATVSLTFCFRLRGCQDPCCFQKAILTNLKWQPRCIDKGVGSGGYCFDSPFIDCTEQCCDCCCVDNPRGPMGADECCNGSWFDQDFYDCHNADICESTGHMYDCVDPEDLPPSIISIMCNNYFGIADELCPATIIYCDYYLTNPDDQLCKCVPYGEEPEWVCEPYPTTLHYVAMPFWETCANTGTAHCALT